MEPMQPTADRNINGIPKKQLKLESKRLDGKVKEFGRIQNLKSIAYVVDKRKVSYGMYERLTFSS